MRFTDEVLMAYVDDELDEPTRASVEAARASDPEIAHRISQQQALRERLHAAFDPLLEEPVPTRLLDLLREPPAHREAPSPEATKSNVIPLPRREAPRRSVPRWMGWAASLLIGWLAGWLAFRTGGPDPVALRNGRMMARGELARALTRQLASTEGEGPAVRVGISFRSKSGEYCRTFTMRAPEVAGLACHAGDGWRLRVLTGNVEQSVATGGYRQAASAMPPAVVVAVSDEILGEPLDAKAEAAARQRGWRP